MGTDLKGDESTRNHVQVRSRTFEDLPGGSVRMLNRGRSRWRTENNRLREMEEVLNAPSQWQEERQQPNAHPTRNRHSHWRPPAAAAIRVRVQKRRRSRNPFPPVVIIADEDDVADIRGAEASSSMSITQTRVERTHVTHRRRHHDHSRTGARRFQGTFGPSKGNDFYR